MLIVHVDVHVNPEQIADFIKASAENARNSLQEPGIARFDVLQDQGDPAHFVLVEVYRTVEDTARHKETAHYTRWRDTVAGMMAAPRTSARFVNRFPGEGG